MFKRGFIFVKRKKEEELDPDKGDIMIEDVKVGRSAPSEGEWEARPGDIWVKRVYKLVEDGVTAVDLLFGADAVEIRPRWSIVGGLFSEGQVQLTIRKGQPVPIEKPELRINDNFKYKIIQISGEATSAGLRMGPRTKDKLQIYTSLPGLDIVETCNPASLFQGVRQTH